jgi:hypothetical protein
LQGLATHYQLRGSWAQWIATTTTTTIINIILKGNWIRTHNIVVVIEDSIATTNAKDSIVIRSADKGEESKYLLGFLSQPYFGPSVGVKPNTPKVGNLESFETPECLEFNSKAQNTSHWGILGVIGKVLKRRYRKWPRIGHLDIFSPSYGQKKGRESN